VEGGRQAVASPGRTGSRGHVGRRGCWRSHAELSLAGLGRRETAAASWIQKRARVRRGFWIDPSARTHRASTDARYSRNSGLTRPPLVRSASVSARVFETTASRGCVCTFRSSSDWEVSALRRGSLCRRAGGRRPPTRAIKSRARGRLLVRRLRSEAAGTACNRFVAVPRRPRVSASVWQRLRGWLPV
jgi:hypothetical protein